MKILRFCVLWLTWLPIPVVAVSHMNVINAMRATDATVARQALSTVGSWPRP